MRGLLTRSLGRWNRGKSGGRKDRGGGMGVVGGI